MSLHLSVSLSLSAYEKSVPAVQRPDMTECSASPTIFAASLKRVTLFFVQFEIPRRVCNLTLTGQVSTNHLILVKKFVMTQHNVTFYRDSKQKKLQNKQTK